MTTPERRNRDRDEDGRARNTRPRDELGRPLPPGSVGVERIPEDLDLPPEKSLAWAQDLLDRGLAFNAHEVLEGAWKSCPSGERLLWQGLAQLAVGITHVQRGNSTGALTLLERAAERIGHGAGIATGGSVGDSEGRGTAPAPHGIDAPGLIAYANQLSADLQLGASPTREQLTPRLRVASPHS